MARALSESVTVELRPDAAVSVHGYMTCNCRVTVNGVTVSPSLAEYALGSFIEFHPPRLRITVRVEDAIALRLIGALL